MRTLVIAEIGAAFGRTLDAAMALVDHAAALGADAAKTQFWSSSSRLAERRRAPELASTYEAARLPATWLPILAEAARRQGIEFMATTYLPEDVELVNPHVGRFKIASFESQDEAFLRAHQRFVKPIIVSTGVCGEEAVARLRQRRRERPGQLSLLYCVSAYPTPLEALRLAEMRWRDLDGLSDHTTSVLTGALAVAAGARIVEKHLRLAGADPANPDFGHSLPPDEFQLYVQNVRMAEAAMGDGERGPNPAEAPWAGYVVR